MASNNHTDSNGRPVTFNQNQCQIHLGPFENPVRLQCRHIFCRGCIEEWRRESLCCPFDRKPSQSLTPVAESRPPDLTENDCKGLPNLHDSRLIAWQLEQLEHENYSQSNGNNGLAASHSRNLTAPGEDRMAQMEEHRAQIKEQWAQLEEHLRKIKERRAQMEEHKEQIKEQWAQLEEHLRKKKERRAQMEKHHRAQIEKHRAQIEKHRAQIEKHRAQMEKHRAQSGKHRAQIIEHMLQISEHQKQRKEHRDQLLKSNSVFYGQLLGN